MDDLMPSYTKAHPEARLLISPANAFFHPAPLLSDRSGK
jgi:hypothetical protein